MALNRSTIMLLSFGLLTAFLSGPGQTYFFSVFNPHLLAEWELSNSLLGSLYAVATLASAFVLPLVGRSLDRRGIIQIALFLVSGLGLGCLMMGWSPGVWALGLGFFLMRFFGQGAMGILSRTVMARSFDKGRGTALAVSNLGYPLAESFMPLIASLLILSFGWRHSWFVCAAVIFVVALPLLYALTRWISAWTDRERLRLAAQPQVQQERINTARDWEVREVLRDPRLFMLLPGILFPPCILTGMIFHHGTIAAAKGWTMQQMATGFLLFGAIHAAVALLIGPLIDRFTARRMVGFYLLPLMAALLSLNFGSETWIIYLYLGLCGTTVGMGHTLKPALIPEMYGIKNLGTINSIFSSLMVFSTAIAPPVFGAVFDAGVPHARIFIALTVLGALCTVLMFPGLRPER